jgi:hypothetical protein
MKWFEVDKEGLARLLERKGKEFVLYELIQNAWDADGVKEVHVLLTRVEGSPYVIINVEDDSPDGFRDLRHAFTLFADSEKKPDAEKRGRFNLGEKLVLALCESAAIHTTTGLLTFDKDGRRENVRNKRPFGSHFHGRLRMTNEEMAHCGEAIERLLPPVTVKTWFNGKPLYVDKPLCTVSDVSLTTEVSDRFGVLRRVSRPTTMSIHDTEGKPGWLYEMGIPVVETGDRFHVNVHQKVPLNFDRDNVTPAYLSRVRAIVTEVMAERLTTNDANATWVRDAVERHGDTLPDPVIDRLVTLRFGAKRVSYDPSDPEANSIAVMDGYTVVHGPQMSAAEWDAARRAGAIKPAGQVTPSPKPFHPDGTPLRLLEAEKWTQGIHSFVDYATRLARELLDVDLSVVIANDSKWGFDGAYGNKRLTVNVAALGYAWFSADNDEEVNSFLIHEFGHEYAGDHLSHEYHDALCRLGAKMTALALTKPNLFDWDLVSNVNIDAAREEGTRYERAFGDGSELG